MAQVIREALAGVAAEDLREHILGQALYVSNRETIPEGGEALRDFVEVRLREAIEYVLGAATAEVVIEQLRPIVDMAADEEDDDVSGVRLSSPVAALDAALGMTPFEDAGTTGAPGPGAKTGGLAMVLIATLDESRLTDLSGVLGTAVTVVRVDDPLALLDGIQTGHARRLVVVVDCKHPSVQPATMAAMSPELPAGAHVVLWGADDRTESALAELGDHMASWVRCSSEAKPSDVAAVCAMLLG